MAAVADGASKDRERAALLLQGASLVSHLDRVGWRVASWHETVVDQRGALRAPAGSVTSERDDRLPQAIVRSLVELLFGSEDVAGRSVVRSALRPMLASWCDGLLPLPGDRLVTDILDRAPFLWGPEFVAARSSLFAVLDDGQSDRVVVAGPYRWQRALLRAAGGDPQRQSEILCGDGAEACWLGGDDGDGPVESIRRGSWRRPLGVSGQCRLVGEERSAAARALLERGRFEAALHLIETSRRTEDILIRLGAQVRMARMTLARRSLSTLESRRLEGAAALERCRLAIWIHASAGRPAPVREWSERALDLARGSHRARGRAVAALAKWELGALDDMAGLLEPDEQSEEEGDWLLLLARARMLRSRGRVQEAGAPLGTAIRRFGRRLPLYERAGLWNELAAIRLAADDCAGAERAARTAVALFRRCDGPAAWTEAHGHLARIRVRMGRLKGVAQTVENMRRSSLMAGSAIGVVDAREAEAQLLLAQGRWREALECVQDARQVLRKRRLERSEGRSLALLEAQALLHLGRRDEAAAELTGLMTGTAFEWTPAERRVLPPVLLQAGLDAVARSVAVGTDQADLWRRLSDGNRPTAVDWQRIEKLNPHRLATTVHELVCLGVESIPTSLLFQAARTLSALGAEPLAQRVDAARQGPWKGVRAFLEGTDTGADALRRLLSAAGRPEARIELRTAEGRGEGSRDGYEVLLAGPGGAAELSVATPGGRLVLNADRIDEPERALMTLIASRSPVASSRRSEVTELAEARRSAVHGMIGRSKPLLEAQARIEKFAAHDLPVLIVGESGTGKELLARQLHNSSPRSSQPWLAVNCAALPEGLLLSDLFGHVRGSFTGADRDRIGVFETAAGGTVFLDEIGELPWVAQGMLLRILQEGEMRRVGESRPRRLDFRLVSATHRDLSALVEAGKFREDLYYRLRVAHVDVPPLRDRDDDVTLLTAHFLDRLGGATRKLRLDDTARRRIRTHSWPGNVRELKNAIEAAVALADGPEITFEILGLPEKDDRPSEKTGHYHFEVQQYQRRLIRDAIAGADGNHAQAARDLGLTRQALSYLVRRLGYSPVTDR